MIDCFGVDGRARRARSGERSVRLSPTNGLGKADASANAQSRLLFSAIKWLERKAVVRGGKQFFYSS